MAGAVIRGLGGVEVIVHCVGASFARPGGALALSDADWEAALATSLLFAVRIDRELLPVMVWQGSGSVVHVSSAQWMRPESVLAGLRAAKAALVSCGKVLATGFAARGVRVSVVTPGLIAASLAGERVELIRQSVGGTREEAVAERHRGRRRRREPPGTVRDYGSIVSRLMRPSRSVNLNCRSATPPGKLPSR